MQDLIRKLKQDHGWDHGGLNAMILLKRPEKKIVLTALHPGTEINSYQSNDSITIHIIEGALIFQTKKRSAILKKDQLLTLKEKTKYSLTSSEETVFMMTIESQMMAYNV
ncbi:MAG TPA: hypothetical protein VK179_13650 [Bacteroidales bacterium]|nr:hypothetical protein [Bacteroidales bacterium]